VNVETAEAIDRLGDRIDAVHTSLGAEVSDVRAGLEGVRADLAGLRTEVGDLRTEVGDLRVDMGGLRTALYEGLDENRRHALVLNESTRHDVQLVAEGVAALAVKIDSLGRRPIAG
jgi:hypothetical protein